MVSYWCSSCKKTTAHSKQDEKWVVCKRCNTKRSSKKIRSAWEHQKTLKQQKLSTPEDIYNKARSITHPMHQALFVLCYLTAGRITEVLELTKDRITTAPEMPNVMLIDLPNRKNKKKSHKLIPINLNNEFEKKLFKLVLEYISNVPDSQTLFHHTRQWGWRTLRKYDFNPHFLRHIRLTHLVTQRNFSDQKLAMFAGWTDSRGAKPYMELKWRDLL